MSDGCRDIQAGPDLRACFFASCPVADERRWDSRDTERNRRRRVLTTSGIRRGGDSRKGLIWFRRLFRSRVVQTLPPHSVRETLGVQAIAIGESAPLPPAPDHMARDGAGGRPSLAR